MKYLSSRLRLLFLFALLLLTAARAHAQTWQWANAPGAGEGKATAVDAAGNVYVTGTFSGTATFGTTTLVSTGGTDVFVAKLNSSGVYQWAVKAGGSTADGGAGLALDGSANVYVTGFFTGNATFGATALTSAGNYDPFVAKLSSAGAWQWTVRAGSSGDDGGRAIAVDVSGNVAVTGYFSSPATFGATTLTTAGAYSAYAAKLTTAGAWQWAMAVPNNTTSDAGGIGIDGSGNVYLTGRYSGTAVFGTTSLISIGNQDVFVVKLTSAGAWQWAVSGGGTSADVAYALTVDAGGTVTVAGYTYGGGFGATTISTSAGGSDAFVARLSTTGAWQWATSTGGSQAEIANGLALDAAGNAYVTGYFTSDPATFGTTGLPNTDAGDGDDFVAKLSPSGAWQWAARAGGFGGDYAYGIAVDASGNVSVVGQATGPSASFGTIGLPNTTAVAALFVSRLTQTPTVSSFTPPAGVPTSSGGAAGTYVTITGTNLLGVTAVSFGGVAAILTGTGSGTSIGAYVPMGAATGPIAVTTAYGTATSAANFTVYGPPNLLSFTPTGSGSGASVVISGTNLTGATSVKFNSVAASYTVNSATQITATVPTGATTGPMTIVTPGGTVSSSTLYTVAAPVITTFTATSGAAGDLVVLTGQYFSGATAVKFNGTAASIFINISDTQLNVTVPGGATTGKISVVTPAGTGTSAANFTIVPVPRISTFAPTSGPVGTTVTVTGSNFTGTTGVQINGVDATSFTVVSATQLTAVVATGTTTGLLTVTNATGSGGSATNFTVTTAPTITSFSPGSGPTGAGVTITGTNFTGATVVSFNLLSAPFTVNSATSITATVPASATAGSAGAVRVTTPTGTAVSAGNYTVLAASGVVFDIDSATALPGAQVVVPVRVRGFSAMLGLQGTLQFNPAQLTLVGVEQFNATLTGLATANFTTTAAAATGVISFAYLNATTASLTLADNSVVFALRFTVPATAATGSRQPLWWVPGPVLLEATRATFAAAIPQALGGAVLVPPAALISGTVRTGNATAVPGVTIGVSGPLAPVAPVTPPAGTYSLPALVGTGAYTLTPSKANDLTVTNGVTITDLALVRRHILGTALLSAAYKAVSADVNNDAAITVADVAAIQSFILGTTTSFTGGALWRFYSSVQTFANVNSPWPLTTSRTYASLATSNLAQDFVACKLGDVNDSWNAAIPRAATTSADTLRVGFPSITVAPAGRFRLPLVVQAGPACGGLQGEISWDPAALRLIGTIASRPGLVVGVADTAAGHLPVLWTDPAGQPLHGPATLVEVAFETRPGTAPGTVTLVDGPRTALLALDSALAPLTLHVLPGVLNVGPVVQGVAGHLAASAVAVWPNPAHTAVQVSGTPGAAVTLLDGLGRVVYTTRLDAAGATTLDLRGLPAGVYAARVGSAARRLVVE